MNRLLRFRDLQERGVVRSWPQLKHLQQNHGFPIGKMLSANSRVWDEGEVDEWVAARPTENTRPLQGAAKARHERRRKTMHSDVEA
jgi:predicted DNA-binding transcriptional regulator AlpA